MNVTTKYNLRDVLFFIKHNAIQRFEITSIAVSAREGSISVNYGGDASLGSNRPYGSHFIEGDTEFFDSKEKAKLELIRKITDE